MAGENVRRVYEIDVKLAAEAAAALRTMQQNMKNLGDDADEAKRKLKNAFGGTLGFNLAVFGQITQGVEAVIQSVRLLSGVSLAQGVASVQADLERLRLGFSTISATGLSGAGEQIEYVRRVTRDLGVEFSSAAQSYLKFSAAARGTNIEGQKSRDIFEALVLASRNLGLSTYQTENAFRALEQIVSKGVVQQEELRGQLSEAIPGASQIAARAFGVTTEQLNKLIKEGEVFADEFIPKFAKQLRKELGGNVVAGVNESIVALNLFKSSFEQTLQSLTDAGLGNAAAGVLRGASTLFDDIGESFRKTKKETDGFIDFLKNAGRAALEFSEINAKRAQVIELATLDARLASGVSTSGDPISAATKRDIERRIAELRPLVGQFVEARKQLEDAQRPKATAADARRVDVAQERLEYDALTRIFTKLTDEYKDLNAQRDVELRQLEKLKDAGRFKENPAEYDRIRAAILKKTEVVNDDTRAAQRSEKALAEFIERLKEEISAFSTLTVEQEKSKKQAREEAQLSTLASEARTKKGKTLVDEARALLEVRNAAELTKQATEADTKAQEEYTKAIEKRIEKLREQATADEFAADIFGREKEQVAQLSMKKLELAKTEAELALIQKIDRGGREEDIEQLRILIAEYERAISAKQGLLGKERDLDTQKLIDEADKRESRSVQQRTDELRARLVEGIKRSKDVGQAFVDVLQDKLEERVFKVVLEPLTDPLVNALQSLIDEFAKGLSEAFRGAASGSGGSGDSFFAAAGKIIASWFTFADGGIMSPGGPVPLRRYASGGVANSPQMALYGEGDMSEAFVPLPDGRSIPVTMKGGGASDVYVSVYFTGTEGKVSKTESRQTSRGTEIAVFIEQLTDAMSADIKRGRGLAPALESQYGLNRAAGASR